MRHIGKSPLGTLLDDMKNKGKIPKYKNKSKEKNMEDSKYYTPSLEEFHIGFEYEYCMNPESNTKFTKEICDRTSIDILLDDFEHEPKELFELTYRVKYLDKEDIESLGFKYIGKSIDIWFDLEGHFDMGTWTSYKCVMHYNLKDHILCINMCDVECDSNVFRGVIKNKSELKKVLNQINVKYKRI